MSNSEIVSTDPCTDEVVWRGPTTSPSELDAVMARARQGFRMWSGLSLEERHRIGRAFADLAKAQFMVHEQAEQDALAAPPATPEPDNRA